MPAGWLKAPTIVLVTTEPSGRKLTLENPPPAFAVHILAPSKAMPRGVSTNSDVRVVTAPAGCWGSIWYRLLVPPVTKTFPIATSTPKAADAPVQVSISLPSLALTLATVPLPEFATQRSAPSDLTSAGLLPTMVAVRLLTP